MIIDQLFDNNKKNLNEADPRNFDSDEDYYAAQNAPAKRRSAPSNYPYSQQEDDDYFREIFRKKREAAAKAEQDKEQGVAEDMDDQQLDELSFKDIQRGANKFTKSANKFTKNVADTGAAVGNAAGALGGAIKQVGKTTVADPLAATYNATKSGLGKAADLAKGVYGDAKQGTQAVGQAVDTVGTDVGQGLQKLGRGAANVAIGTVGALGSVAGGATTGLGRAGVKGFNTGVQNVGGDAVDRAETNVFTRKSDPVQIKKQIELKQQEIADLETELNTANQSGQAQKSMPFYGTNPATGQARTYDELLAKSQAGAAAAASTNTAAAPAAGGPPAFNAGNAMSLPGMEKYAKKAAPVPAATPNFAPQGSGYARVNQPTVPKYTVAQAPGAQLSKDDYIKRIGADAMAESRIATALKTPVAEMLQMVETKEDVQKIKQFVDQTFTKYGAVNESAFALRNQILEHVTQVGAQRRREHACKS